MSPLTLHALKGAKWAVGGRLLRTFTGLGTISILSRFLTPTEFGIIALITFVAGFAQVLTDFGTRVALVQRKDVTRIEQDSVFWSNIALSAVAVLGINLFAPQISELLGSPGMETPLRAVSPIFVLGALHGVSLSVLERSFAFDRVAISEVTSALAGAATAIGMALAGYKIEALVAQQLVMAAVYAAMILWQARWRPSFSFSLTALRPLLAYGSYVTASGLVFFASSRADRPIIGNKLTAADLGYAAMAEQVVQSPIKVVVQMVRRVMFPIMSSIQDDNARLRRGYLTIQHALLLVMAPVALGLWAVAEPLVAVLLGSGWGMVATLMGYLTVRAAFNTFNDFNSVVFSAKGRAKFQFKWSIFASVLTIGTILITVDYGIEAVVAGRLAMTILLTPVNSYFALKLIDQRPGELIGLLIRPAVSAIVMAAAVTWLRTLINVSAVTELAVCLPMGVVVYVAMELLIDRPRVLPLLRRVLNRQR